MGLGSNDNLRYKIIDGELEKRLAEVNELMNGGDVYYGLFSDTTLVTQDNIFVGVKQDAEDVTLSGADVVARASEFDSITTVSGVELPNPEALTLYYEEAAVHALNACLMMNTLYNSPYPNMFFAKYNPAGVDIIDPFFSQCLNYGDVLLSMYWNNKVDIKPIGDDAITRITIILGRIIANVGTQINYPDSIWQFMYLESGGGLVLQYQGNLRDYINMTPLHTTKIDLLNSGFALENVTLERAKRQQKLEQMYPNFIREIDLNETRRRR